MSAGIASTVLRRGSLAGKTAKVVEKVDDGLMGEYKSVKGHHVHAKAGFKDHFRYDPNKGFSISQDFMEANGWIHKDMTSMQRKLFKELAGSGRTNTIYEHTRIAVEALKAGGVPENYARQLVAKSLYNLRSQGVYKPSNIPWYNKVVKEIK